MAVTFLGYIDKPEEGLISGATRRCLFGLDTAADASDLPTTGRFETETGCKTAAPAPWSVAVIAATGAKKYFNGTSWAELTEGS